MMPSRQFIVFGILTFALLSLVPLPDLLLAAGGENLTEVAARASKKTGLVWTSNLLVVIRTSIAEPVLVALLIGSVVPTMAAVLTRLFVKRPSKWQVFLVASIL